METVVADSVARPRLQAVLLGAFAALVMACVGLYGLMSYSVAIAACYLPARRATRIDPARVLRDE